MKWALLLSYDRSAGTVRLHDVMRKFLRDRAGPDGVRQQAQALTAAYAASTGADLAGPERFYYYRYLPEHLFEAGDRAALDAKLLDPGWLQAKLAATTSTLALASDYEKLGQGRMQSLVGRTLRLIAGICARDPRQLMPQLLGRLSMTASADPGAPAFLAAVRRHVILPAILTQRPSLTPPGAEIARLEGHRRWVEALVVLPDGRLASGGEDGTVRLWDPARGSEAARLEAHGGVGALAVLPDGRLASGGYDHTIRLWDPASGAETTRLEGHGGVWALAVLPDGRLASGGYDHTIRLAQAARTAQCGSGTPRVAPRRRVWRATTAG
jgi:WD domain, G-beta repeat